MYFFEHESHLGYVLPSVVRSDGYTPVNKDSIRQRSEDIFDEVFSHPYHHQLDFATAVQLLAGVPESWVKDWYAVVPNSSKLGIYILGATRFDLGWLRAVLSFPPEERTGNIAGIKERFYKASDTFLEMILGVESAPEQNKSLAFLSVLLGANVKDTLVWAEHDIAKAIILHRDKVPNESISVMVRADIDSELAAVLVADYEA
jgi:hypothetical protein